MRTQDVDPQDYKYIVAKPDASFSPQRNKAIVDETIAETTKFFQETGRILNDQDKLRVSVLSSYGQYRFNRGTKTFKDYVGKNLYKELIGERVLSKARIADTVNKLKR
jgi:hypothetical protein